MLMRTLLSLITLLGKNSVRSASVRILLMTLPFLTRSKIDTSSMFSMDAIELTFSLRVSRVEMEAASLRACLI